MVTIAFHIQKGGTGKTSCAGTVAGGIARLGYKTALIDCDQQGNTSSWFLTDSIAYELSDVLTGKTETGRALKEIAPSFFLLPVSPLDGNLTAFAENHLIRNPKCFEFLIADLASAGFKYIIFDCSPSFSQLERAVIGAVDEVITPLTPEYFSMDGIEIFTKELSRIRRAMRRPIIHDKIICNMVNRSFSHHLAFRGNLQKLSFRVFTVPQDTNIPKAQIYHQSIFDYDPKSRSVPSFEEIIKAVTERNQP